MKIINYNKIEFVIADAQHPMYTPKTFPSLEEAILYRDKHYINRNKGDEHDEYWQNRPQLILKVTTEVIC